LNRKRPIESRDSLGSVIEQLRSGEGLVIFPEGTYYRDRMGPGHSGMVRLILSRLSPAFIPVGINYCRKGWRTRVRVRFGNVFHADPGMSATAVVDLMMRDIARLSDLEITSKKPHPEKC